VLIEEKKMKRISRLTFAISILSAVSLQIPLWAGCGGGRPKPYTSKADSFSVTFPRGSDLSAPQNKDYGGGIFEWRHRAISGDSAYEVIVTTFPADFTSTHSAKEILDKGLEFERGTIFGRQETTFQGVPAVVSKSEFSGGSRTVYVRSVTFFVGPKHKLYSVRAAGRDKTVLDSAAADEFINSFKLD
jgi:hypothetical protein